MLGPGPVFTLLPADSCGFTHQTSLGHHGPDLSPPGVVSPFPSTFYRGTACQWAPHLGGGRRQQMEECLHCCLTACRFEIDPGPNMFMGKAFKTWHHAVPRTRSVAAPQARLFVGGGGKRVKEQFLFACKVGMDYLATQI